MSNEQTEQSSTNTLPYMQAANTKHEIRTAAFILRTKYAVFAR
jgi:hypothetical protein